MGVWKRMMTVLPLLLSTGCAATQLKYSTGRQASTLAGTEYRQVLDNLAAFVDNPGVMPSFSVVGQGTIQINDSGGLQDTLNWAHGHFATSAFSLGALSRTVSEQWTIAPITDPDKLKKIRCLFQIAAGGQYPDCYNCQEQLSNIAKDDRCQLNPCWFNVGGKWQIPKDAVYVGRHGNTFVWVSPDGVDSLTRLTLAVLDIATAGTAAGAGAAASVPGFVPETTPRMNFYFPLPGLTVTPPRR